nr:MAG TPA: hypothetical protein [Caudoviricetes sp.]
MKLFLTDFVFKFPGKNSRRYPNSDESVNQLRKVMGNFRSVLISQVDFARVREFIADDAASMEQVENICGCAKHVYLFNQRAFCAKAGFTFSGKIHHKLQAYTKEGASSARRKSDDALSFIKEFFGFFRHVLSGFHTPGNRIDHFFALPKNQSVAGLALAYNGLLMRKHLSDIGNAYGRIRPHYVEAAHRIALRNRRLNFGNN